MNNPHEGDMRTAGNALQVFISGTWVDYDPWVSDYEKGRADMLNEVIGWLEKYEAVGLERDNFVVCLTYELKRAMRPQKES